MRRAIGLLFWFGIVGSAHAASPPKAPQFFSIAALLVKETKTEAPSGHDAPFTLRGHALFRIETNAAAAKWAEMEPRIDRDIALITSCADAPRECAPRLHAIHALASEARSLVGSDKAQFINARVNSLVGYESDLSRHGVEDVWSAPLETLGARGDCEDYAIAKYALLKASGLEAEALRLVLVHDADAGEDHAILAVRIGKDWTLLDNRSNRVEADAELGHYRPLMSLSTGKAELYAAPLRPARVTARRS